MFAEVTLLHCSMVVVAVVMMNRTHKTKTNVCTLLPPYFALALFCSIFRFFKDRLQFQRWRGKQFCISKALMMFTKNLFCFYKLTQSCCYDLLVFGDALKLQIATSHFTVTLQ